MPLGLRLALGLASMQLTWSRARSTSSNSMPRSVASVPSWLGLGLGLGIALGVGLGVGLGFGALLQPQPPPLRAQRRLRLGLLVGRHEPQLADARLAVRLGRLGLGLGLGLGLEP